MKQAEQSRSKKLRRIVIALEVLVLLAAFAAVRYAASLPKTYQIIYQPGYAPDSGIDLFQPGSNQTLRLVDLYATRPCDVIVQVDELKALINDDELYKMSVGNTPVLFAFATADEIEITRYEKRVVLTYEASRIEIGLSTCILLGSPDGG
jgi:hypothetical protein